MNLSDLLTPWLLLAAVLVPLVYVEKWIHSHLYGVGWLLTDNKKSATALYYVLLFPGVFVHEFTQYLVAGALNLKIKRVIAWPEAQDDGTLRLNFVQVQKANWIQAAIIGAVPLITGLALVWVISSQVLNLGDVLAAIRAGDIDLLGHALKALASKPDFFLWLYMVFTVSNAMLPTPADRQGWPLLMGLFAAVIGFLVLIGVGDVLLETFTGPVAEGVDRIATAFAMVLIIETPGIVLIGFLEEVLERLTKRKYQYHPESAPSRARAGERQPGSNVPLPPGASMPSIYNLELPIPKPSDVAKARQRPAAVPQPELSPGSAAPARERLVPRPSTAEQRPPAPLSPAGDALSPAARSDRPPGLRPTEPGPPEDRPALSPTRSPALAQSDSPAFRERPSGFERSGRDDEDRGFGQPPASPLARPERREPPGPRSPVFPAREAANADAEDDDRPAGYGREARRPDQRPERPDDSPFARPESPASGVSRRLGSESDDDARPARSDRPPSRPGYSPDRPQRPSPLASLDDEDDLEAEDDDELQYEDFEDEDGVLDDIYEDE